MNEDHQNPLDEFFDATTSNQRRNSLKHEIASLKPDSDEAILLSLGTEIRQEEEIENLKKNLSKLKNSRKNKFLFLYIAASVSLLVICGLIFLKTNYFSSKSSEELFSEYYSPLPADIKRGEVNSLSEFYQKYNAKEYRSALELVEENNFYSSEDELLTLLLGNCYLNTNEFQKASTTFESLLKSRKSRSEALWFLSLTALKSGQPEETKKHLKALLEEKSNYKDLASKLIHDIQ